MSGKISVKFLKNNGRMSERIPGRIPRKMASEIVEGVPDEIPEIIFSEKLEKFR